MQLTRRQRQCQCTPTHTKAVSNASDFEVGNGRTTRKCNLLFTYINNLFDAFTFTSAACFPICSTLQGVRWKGELYEGIHGVFSYDIVAQSVEAAQAENARVQSDFNHIFDVTETMQVNPLAAEAIVSSSEKLLSLANNTKKVEKEAQMPAAQAANNTKKVENEAQKPAAQAATEKMNLRPKRAKKKKFE